MIAPDSSSSAVAPMRISSSDTGTDVGYTSKLNAPLPVYLPRMMSAVSVMLSNRPPLQPAITP